MRTAIRRDDLREHPFYLAWSAGTLPVAALTTYAREYGAFIGVLDSGWEALGDRESAAIERAHVELWTGVKEVQSAEALEDGSRWLNERKLCALQSTGQRPWTNLATRASPRE